MNFLAHLLIADRTTTSAAGAILGDIARGSDLSMYPAAIERGIRVHRRVDALTDRHPLLQARKAQFAPASRRYAGIVLDLACDYALAQDWPLHGKESLNSFCTRQATAVAAAGDWFERAGGRAPEAASFTMLLTSYATPAGIDRAVRRTAARLRNAGPLITAAEDWRDHAENLRPQLARILDDIVTGLSDLR